jgi:acetyl-CoA/propionyl-CoA carboxylase, biotin carboxylase, biotin carboxyl carrier protein
MRRSTAPDLHTVLVANRGEIAVRIIRTLRDLGIRSVAVYSDADRTAPHVRVADVALHLGPAPASASYLHIGRILEAARRTGAQAIHPGYGFLSENTEFAQACADAGIVFIGPPPSAIEAMGDKIHAKATVETAGVPVVPGVHRPGMSDEELVAAAGDVGYPLLAKAAAGGGGKGMRIVRSDAELPDALASARREAKGAFGDDALLLERYLERPRHIEVQVLADTHGNVVHLGERECSLQRRHQKVIEECPSPVLDEDMRQRMGAAAVDAARSCGYVGAGTVEFIATGDASEFFFLEMNTRLQVEHPVTEEVYGLDLVEWQVRVAAGEELGFTQDELVPAGHAVEARLYAEDPARGFLPTGGTVLALREPEADGVRVDSGIAAGSVVGSDYDPMLAKVIAYGHDRSQALRRLDRALADYALLGVTTNVGFLRNLLAYPAVVDGRLDTGLIERHIDELIDDGVPDDVYVAAALGHLLGHEPAPGPDGIVDAFDLPGGWRVGEPARALLRLRPGSGEAVDVAVGGLAADAEVVIAAGEPLRAAGRLLDDGRLLVAFDGAQRVYDYVEDRDVAWLSRDGRTWALREEQELDAARHAAACCCGPLVAPMPGTVTVVHVSAGEQVAAGQALMVVEAMKMEHPITAPVAGVVSRLSVSQGDQVDMEQELAVVTPAEDGAAADAPAGGGRAAGATAADA